MKKVEKLWAELSAKAQESTELSAEDKVELSAVGDLKELISDAKRIISLQEDGVQWGQKAESQYNEVMKVVTDAEGITRGALRQAGNLKTESDKVFNKIEVAAKELGINPNDLHIEGYSSAIKLINEMFENQNALSGWNDILKKMI